MKLDWIVEIDSIACSFESWEPQRAPIPWRSRAPVEEPSTASEVDLRHCSLPLSFQLQERICIAVTEFVHVGRGERKAV